MAEVKPSCSSTECYASTSISVRNFTFNWTIKNFSKFPSGTDKRSPTFCPLSNYTFTTTLHLRNESIVYFGIRKSSGQNTKVKNISLVNRLGRVLRKSTIEVNSFSKNIDLAFSNTNWQSIIKRARKSNFLTIRIVVEFWGDDESEIYQFRPKPHSLLDNLKGLSGDLKVFYDTSRFADVNLKVGDNLVRAHKFILSARSSVFARTFETPMNEKDENVINITDLDLPILKDLVSYLYTGELVNDDFETVYALYYAADKYDVSILQKTCVNVMLSNMVIENACRILALADRHSDIEFKDSVMGFIKLNFDEVKETDAWAELVKTVTPLAAEVITLALPSTKRKRNRTGKPGTS